MSYSVPGPNINPSISAKIPIVVSITSGKGGVGKTNISVNLAYLLAKKGS